MSNGNLLRPSWYKLPHGERLTADPTLGLVKKVHKLDLNTTTQVLFRGRCQLLACYVQLSGLNGNTVYVQIHDSTNTDPNSVNTGGLVSGLDDSATGDVLPTAIVGTPTDAPLAMVPNLAGKVTVDGSTFVWESPMAEQGIGLPMDTGVRIAFSSLATIYLAPAIGISSPAIVTLLLNKDVGC